MVPTTLVLRLVGHFWSWRRSLTMSGFSLPALSSKGDFYNQGIYTCTATLLKLTFYIWMWTWLIDCHSLSSGKWQRAYNVIPTGWPNRAVTDPPCPYKNLFASTLFDLCSDLKISPKFLRCFLPLLYPLLKQTLTTVGNCLYPDLAGPLLWSLLRQTKNTTQESCEWLGSWVRMSPGSFTYQPPGWVASFHQLPFYFSRSLIYTLHEFLN